MASMYWHTTYYYNIWQNVHVYETIPTVPSCTGVLLVRTLAYLHVLAPGVALGTCTRWPTEFWPFWRPSPMYGNHLFWSVHDDTVVRFEMLEWRCVGVNMLKMCEYVVGRCNARARVLSKRFLHFSKLNRCPH